MFHTRKREMCLSYVSKHQFILFINYTLFFCKQHFYKQRQAKIGKKLSKSQATPWGWTFPFENYSLSSSTLSSKNDMRYSKKCIKNKCVCFNYVIWLMTIKTRLKMKNRSQIYNRNRPRPKLGHKYTKCKMYLIIMMVICIKQHLSNIWSSIHENS